MKLRANSVLRVNLSTGKISRESLDPDIVSKFLGGRGLGTWYLRHEVEPTTDPLAPENKVFLTPGPLTGTSVPTSARYMVVTKSPLNGGVACSNSGGFWGPELRFAGYDVLIVEGKAAKPTYLSINDDTVELRDASACWGRLVSETTAILQQECGDPKARVLTIGPAGETLSPIAAIMNDKSRAAGRSGVGAVLGSKNLKAIVVRGSQKIDIADADRTKEAVAGAIKAIRAHGVTGTGLAHLRHRGPGERAQRDRRPSRRGNFQESQFAAADQVSGERLAETYLVKNTACYRCPIACGRHCSLDGVEGEGPEYETLWAYSANCGIDQLEPVIRANNLCNEYGLDTISAGATIACAMEMYQRGIIKPEDLDGPAAGVRLRRSGRRMDSAHGRGRRFWRQARLGLVPPGDALRRAGALNDRQKARTAGL